MKLFTSILTFTFLLLATPASRAAPLGTTFTYQGRLNEAGQPVNGSYGMVFYLYDAPTNGSQLGNLGIVNVPVTNGLFTVPLNFDAAFDGNARWLEISVEASGASGFTTLSPRQALTPTPYALFAPNSASATTANNVVANAVSAAQLNTASAPGTGQVLSFNGTGLVWTNASTVAVAWTLNGNSGTIAGTDFVGTTDNQSLELRANNSRALRLEPNTSGAPNIIGGSVANMVDAGIVGATIAGGGATNYLDQGFGYPNSVSANFGVVSGGLNNHIQGNSDFSTIGGGLQNYIATNLNSTISGGLGNVIGLGAQDSTIGGGGYNNIQASAGYSTIGGGIDNNVGTFASVSTIAGGNKNTIQSYALHGVIGGGTLNAIEGIFGSPTDSGTIGGGKGNSIGASFSTIAGGELNAIDDHSSGATIGGGAANTIEDHAGGSVISAGTQNRIQTGSSFSTIGGGWNNTIETNGCTISGGEFNTCAGVFSTVAGGDQNAAFGNESFVAGHRAKANHDGTFVWADSIDADFGSGKTNEFAVRATGGVRFVSGVDSSGVPVAGASLPAGSGSWSSLSDRNSKTNFAPVNPRAVLARLVQVPIQTWNYKTQNESTRHIGPIAQDFSAAFQVGEDSRHIAIVDADGVALAAIQGLDQKVDALKEELRRRDVENAELKQRLESLEKLLGNPR